MARTDAEMEASFRQTEKELHISRMSTFGRHTFRHVKNGKMHTVMAANRDEAARAITRFPGDAGIPGNGGLVMPQTPWAVFKNHDKAYPYGIRDAEGVEVARFNDRTEADVVVALVNAQPSE